jgi:transcription initiation factor TFIIIB Brf1 subunit/transcription initiation factor TFIIB
MATKNNPDNPSVSDMDLTCDSCNSKEIIETNQGYVCSKCGLVLEIPRIKYHKPFIQTKIQHEVSTGNTSIGYQKERLRNKYSSKLKRLQKIQQTKSNEDYIDHSANIEISRILTGLSLPYTFKEPIFKVFKQIRKELQKGTKYRNPEKLIPTLIYFYCKKENIAINEQKLLDIAKVDKKEYNYCKLKVSRLMPEYYERNRKQLIMNKVLGISEQYNLGMSFYYDAKKILMNLWQGIKCTTDDVIAGLVSSIAVLCHYQGKVTVSSICSALHIQMSTIQSQVKRKLIKRFNVTGFKSLVKSADLVRTLIYKLGIFKGIETKESESQEEKEEVSKLIEIQMSDGKHLTASLEKQVIFAIDHIESDPFYVLLKIKRDAQKKSLKKIRSRYPKELTFHKIIYHYPTGPPLLS